MSELPLEGTLKVPINASLHCLHILPLSIVTARLANFLCDFITATFNELEHGPARANFQLTCSKSQRSVALLMMKLSQINSILRQLEMIGEGTSGRGIFRRASYEVEYSAFIRTQYHLRLIKLVPVAARDMRRGR